ncbi:uncharacterized protein ASPGLDRAFT_46356 [Aspergillus glaucus CBS 516.65]|uniref:Uncharacterized protein n=1 Tax=Aspergillus glaucus CBS 516.65 TaxID=1160497 RepID=A0A1L9VN37_ASPGL|nr:hypothetical protein ASPGLDRAFT_46356 [Aspergillus glaucus CBS 516.65]OJJ85348.1 hypothetical protein ASPGLDRAFT_46356 [Aspergillus glaucus CBS 516.65]
MPPQCDPSYHMDALCMLYWKRIARGPTVRAEPHNQYLISDLGFSYCWRVTVLLASVLLKKKQARYGDNGCTMIISISAWGVMRRGRKRFGH